MNLGRVKTFLIVLFLGINIYLAISLFMSTRFFVDKDTVNSTVSVLQKNGITLNSKDVLRSVINLKNIDTNNIIYAEKFKNATDDKSFKRDNDNFVWKIAVPSVHKQSDSQIKNNVERILLNSGFETKFMKPGKMYTDSSGDRAYIIRCYVGDYEIFDSSIKVKVLKDNIVVSGRWYEPLSDEYRSKSRSRDTVYITSVLVSMVQNDAIMKEAPFEITDIDYGYLAGTSYGEGAHVTTSALPYYRIKDSKNNVYYYDAKNGSYLK